MERILFQFEIMQSSSKLSNSGIFVYCQMFFQCFYAKVFSSLEQFSITCMLYGRNVRSRSINNIQGTNRWLDHTMIHYWKTVQLKYVGKSCWGEICWASLQQGSLPFFDILRWTLPLLSVKGFRSEPCLFPDLHLLIAGDIAFFR